MRQAYHDGAVFEIAAVCTPFPNHIGQEHVKAVFDAVQDGFMVACLFQIVFKGQEREICSDHAEIIWCQRAAFIEGAHEREVGFDIWSEIATPDIELDGGERFAPEIDSGVGVQDVAKASHEIVWVIVIEQVEMEGVDAVHFDGSWRDGFGGGFGGHLR